MLKWKSKTMINEAFKDDIEIDELYFFSINTREVYDFMIKNLKNIEKKMFKNNFNFDLALKAFYNITDFANKLYFKEFKYNFSTNSRFNCALILMKEYLINDEADVLKECKKKI